ncbi:MAG: hypothetical protein ABFS30_01895 [Pseudomonadota bacterium]
MKGVAVRMKAFGYVSALGLVMAFAGPALACGWWGDGEMNQEGDEIAADGKPVGETATSPIPAGLEAARLPGEAGYGIAVFRPDMAIPYLRATNGRRIARIGQLKEAGFVAIIDLGTPAAAGLHRVETETLGMQYVNIPAIGGMPTAKQVELFTETIEDPANRPLVVYAPESSLLGNMWVLHRLGQGAYRGTALGEGLTFGVSRELEESLGKQ